MSKERYGSPRLSFPICPMGKEQSYRWKTTTPGGTTIKGGNVYERDFEAVKFFIQIRQKWGKICYFVHP